METETGYDKKGKTQTKSFAVFRFLVKTLNNFFVAVLKLFHFKTTENAAIVQYFDGRLLLAETSAFQPFKIHAICTLCR